MTKKPSGDKAFARQVAELNRKAMAQDKVVSLSDYKHAAKTKEQEQLLQEQEQDKIR
jgi:hypothetical protein